MTKRALSTSEVRSRIDDERTWWEGILQSATPAQMSMPGVAGTWTLKDIVGHLSGWQRWTLDRLAAGIQGEPEPSGQWPADYLDVEHEEESVERINNWIYDSNRDRSVEDVLAESRAQWNELRALIDTIPEAVLNEVDRFPFLKGSSLGQSVVNGELFDHFREEHEPGIRAWIDGL